MSTVHPDAGVLWFTGLGFRPAVWTPPHRHDEVDPPRLVPSPDADEPLLSKYDAPAGHGFGFVLWPDIPTAPQITAASLAGVVHGPFTAGPLIPGSWPDTDGPCCIETGPFYPLPDPPPVSLPASSICLLAGLAALALLRRRAK